MNAVVEAWERTLRRRGDDRAVAEAGTGNACTFRELDRGANAWLEAHARDVAALRGKAVVFAMPNGIRWLEIFLGLARAGAVVVPLDGAEPASSQRQTATALRAGAWWDGQRLESLSGARRFRDPATFLIKLTSGTTGAPRPLVFTAEQMLADARQVTGTMGIRARDLNYALIPFGHSYGLGNLTLPLFAHGVPVVCGTAPLPQAVADDFGRWNPTVFPTVPALLRGLLAAEISASQLASLRLVISAGSPLAPDVAKEFAARFGRRVHSFYGSSETGGIAYDRSGAGALRGEVGEAMRGVTIARVAGERIRVGSAAVFTFGNSRRVGRHGAFVPQDRVRLDGTGNIALLGRRGTTVKIGGRRINVAEVAARLRKVPGVRDVWVGASGGAEPVLGAALATARTVAEIRGELLADTAAWKMPKRWTLLPELPLTARGKVDARALQRLVFGAT